MSSSLIEKLMSQREVSFSLVNESARSILDKALDGEAPTHEELSYLAKLQGAEENFALFHTARKICERHFGRKIFLYGFVYFSTHCRNHCSFCFYRASNDKPPRYRKSLDEIVEIVAQLVKSKVHLVDLTMGDDPLIHGEKGSKPLLDICETIKEDFNVPLMVSPGVLPREVLSKLSRLGADWYALYQETHNRALFSKLRVGQDYDERMMTKVNAVLEGLLIEEGILLGIGENMQDLVDSVFEMKRIGAHQVRAMGFVPQHGIHMKNPTPSVLNEMRAIALLRLVHQDRIIPASYDIDGSKNLELRIMAGANTITSLIPPGFGLAGVAQADLNIDNGLRTAEGIKPHLERLGLEPAGRRTYQRWIETERASLKR